MMSEEWRTFLLEAGAVIKDGRVVDFGNPPLETQVAASGEVIADLSHRALIAVRGADAEKFLQGQFTNDILAVTDGQSQLSAYCSPKGRVLALFRIFRREQVVYLALPEPLLQPTLERLRKYVMMSKVTLAAESELTQLGYSGARGIQHLRALTDPLPEAVNGVSLCRGITVIRIPGPHPRYEFIGPEVALKTLWNQLDVHAAPVGDGPWALLDILAGIPSLYPETMDAFIPQMINLDLLGAINFKKGCYTGQEIIARTHYLGKPKRRLYRLHCSGDDLPAPATAIYNTRQRSDEAAGTVVSAQAAPEGGIALLAVLHTESADQGELRLGNNDGPPCAIIKGSAFLQHDG